MRKRFYSCYFNDNPNTSRSMQRHEALAYAQNNSCKLLNLPWEAPKIHGIKRDGFVPHHSKELGYVGGPRDFARKCKEKGYEVATEKPVYKAPKPKMFDDAALKDAVDKGATLSGRECEMLKDI